MEKTHELSSGNIFADLGFPDSEQELVKAKLTVEIFRRLRDLGVTQTQGARMIGTTQAQVSALMRCKPVNVSVGKLMEYLTKLGQDIDIAIRPAEGRDIGRMTVTVAS